MIKALFLDIGGVLLTNGWDHKAREHAAKEFQLNFAEMEERHYLSFDGFERGILSLEEYLKRVVFYQKRSFTLDAFRTFMFDQSKPFPDMLELIRSLKEEFGLKIAAVSNEGRELNEYRVRTFKLDTIFDYFVSSSIVSIRKPDYAIYRLAFDLGQFTHDEALYVDDRPLLIEIAESYGVKSLRHIDFASTKQQLLTLLTGQ